MDFEISEDYHPPPKHINSISVPNDEYLELIQMVYNPSLETKTLKSESNRNIFAEEFNTKGLLSLEDACLKTLAVEYEGGPLKCFIADNLLLAARFYEYLKVDIPLEWCIDFDQIAINFWKKIFLAKCKNKMEIYQKLHETSTDWKKLAVSLKFTELLENSCPETWMLEEQNKIAELCKDYITELHITQLQSRSESSFKQAIQEEDDNEIIDVGGGGDGVDIANNVDDEDESDKTKDYDYPVKDCHHIDLALLGILENLTSLTIEYVPPSLGFQYLIRHFRFSYTDVKNLADGIQNLHQLKCLRIRRSLMDCEKLAIILRPLEVLHVEELDFSFCSLNDDCGDPFYQLLTNVTSIKRLELEKNYFRKHAMKNLAYGITSYKGQLDYLGLGGNPISTKGLNYIIKALISSKQVNRLSLSAIKVNNDGVTLIVDHLIKLHSPLLSINLNATEIGCFPAIENFVNVVEENQIIEQIECTDCGLNFNDEFNINLLMKRNEFIRENPYIGNEEMTQEEIDAFINRVKNPILLKTFERLEKIDYCEERRKSIQKEEDAETVISDLPSLADVVDTRRYSIESESAIFQSSRLLHTEPYQLDPNDFNGDQLIEHLQIYKPSDKKFFSYG